MPTDRRPTLFDQLEDPTSDVVKDAVTRTCRICEAEPGKYCHHITNGQPLPGRLVHFDRTTP
jgi:hypothetical protein